MATKQQVVTDLVKHDPDTYIGLVGSPEFGTPDFAKHRKKLSKDKRVVGVRMRERPRDKDFFNDDVWRDLSLLADMNQTLDVRMFHYSSEDADMIAGRLPNCRSRSTTPSVLISKDNQRMESGSLESGKLPLIQMSTARASDCFNSLSEHRPPPT